MKEYLKNNTKIREDLLNQKLFFDLKEASARTKVHLKFYHSDVDIDGYDIIIENNDDHLIKCQLKSTVDATTAHFDIHSIMLRPNWYIYQDLGFNSPNRCPSDNRGVILIDADVKNEKIICKYSYFNIYLLRALELGIFKINRDSKRIAESLIDSLNSDEFKSNEKVSVLKSLFFPVKDADSLLGIMDFNSIHNSNISYLILQISKIVSGTSENNYSSSKERISDMQGYWQANRLLRPVCHELWSEGLWGWR